MQQAEITSFLRNYATGNYNENDHRRFVEWLNTAPMREIEGVMEEYRTIAGDIPFSENRSPQIIAEIESALNRWDACVVARKPVETKVFNLKKSRRIRSAVAAAAVIAVLVVSGYWLLHKEFSGNQMGKSVASVVHDVQAPKTTKATITLSNSSVIYVDSANNGVLALQGNVNIVKTAKAGIAYNSVSDQIRSDGKIEYNTLHNPRGSLVVSLTLADRTKVWLNAASSLRYPVSFSGNKRKVEVTGEAYFEVAKNANKKFIVNANGVVTEVLGTHFNVNAYKEEGRTVVTLLEGAVRVKNAESSAVIQPGQQVVVTNSVHVVNNADIEAVMAWKSGEFIMKSANVDEIMRQISRWYNVDVTYEAGIPDIKISGEVSRNLNLSQVLQVLKYSGVHVKLEGKKVVVMP